MRRHRKQLKIHINSSKTVANALTKSNISKNCLIWGSSVLLQFDQWRSQTSSRLLIWPQSADHSFNFWFWPTDFFNIVSNFNLQLPTGLNVLGDYAKWMLPRSAAHSRIRAGNRQVIVHEGRRAFTMTLGSGIYVSSGNKQPGPEKSCHLMWPPHIMEIEPLVTLLLQLSDFSCPQWLKKDFDKATSEWCSLTKMLRDISFSNNFWL